MKLFVFFKLQLLKEKEKFTWIKLIKSALGKKVDVAMFSAALNLVWIFLRLAVLDVVPLQT